MNARVSLVLLALSATGAQAGTVLVIDDFTDSAEIQLPGGPDTAVTQNVGELRAERTLSMWRSAPDYFTTIARADINGGEYLVDMEDAGETTIVDLVYKFPISDFSGYEAIILDVSLWPHDPIDSAVIVPPALTVIAFEAIPRPFIHVLVRDLQRGVAVGKLVLPLDSFTNRGGGPIDGRWDVINELQIRVGAHSVWGPWEIGLDRISLGPAIPEPSTIYLVSGCVGCLLLLCHLRRTGADVLPDDIQITQ